MKFKIGQKVVLVKDWCSCKIGDIAIVVNPSYISFGRTYVSISWVRNKGIKDNRIDGGYYLDQFESAIKVGEQLEFDFMYED